MSETAKREFWKDIKPIPNAYKRDAMAGAYIKDAAVDDERYYAPLSDTVWSRPLWISPQEGKWCDVLMAKKAGLVMRHYHPHEIFAYTIAGKWGYLEHDWTATAGDFVYESPGEGHTLVVYDTGEVMKAMFIVTGPLIWLDESGGCAGYFDVFDYIDAVKAHYEKVGLGSALIDQLFVHKYEG